MTSLRMTVAGYRKFTAAQHDKPKKARKPRREKEAAEQAIVIAWARNKAVADPERYPDLDSIFCSLAGVSMTEAQAGRAKAQGNRAGVFDLILLVPRGGHHGLLIEMKADKGKVSDDQDKELERLTRLGYRAAICYGHQQAIDEIQNYYKNGREA